MNDSIRTPSKQAKLKLKTFFKRIITIKVFKSLLDCKTDHTIRTIKGSGSGGGCRSITSNKTYILEEAFPPTYIRYIKKTEVKFFNKPQLKGKLILIEGTYFRII